MKRFFTILFNFAFYNWNSIAFQFEVDWKTSELEKQMKSAAQKKLFRVRVEFKNEFFLW